MRNKDLDDLLSKIQIQKAATPIPAPSSLEEAANEMDHLKPNGVLLERRSNDEGDINEKQISAIQSLLQRCNEEVVYDKNTQKKRKTLKKKVREMKLNLRNKT